MRAEDLVFWLDAIRPSDEITGGVLCRRHADSMVVPRNWTLDDLRDPELHLFRPPTITRAARPRARRTAHRDDAAEQLQLGVVPEPVDESNDAGVSGSGASLPPPPPTPPPPLSETATTTEPAVVSVVESADADRADADFGVAESGEADADGDPVSPWVPTFDSADDLDGLLSARSPLLARAFRGDGRRS
jgi:hypothetical protein